MDTISVFVGVLIGVVVTAFAVEVGLKKLFRPPMRTKMTAAWRVADMEAPLVVTTDPGAIPMPRGAQIVTSGETPEGIVGDHTFRRNANARGNFVVDSRRDRALVFSGPMTAGTLALSTTDHDIVGRLRAEHRRLWETGETYVEDLVLSQVAGRIGATVRTRGNVVESVPYRGRHLLRLSEGAHTIGVLVDAPLDVVGAEVVVVGRATRGQSGYPVLEADEVRRVGNNPTPTARAPPTGTRRVDTPPPRAAMDAAKPAASAHPWPEADRQKAKAAPAAKVAPAPAEPSAETDEEPEVTFEEESPARLTEAERRKLRAKVVLR